MDLTKYEKIFTQESGKYLKDLDDLLMSVEKDLINRDLWSEIHGKIHSIKGMAGALSMERITKLSHSMENWCKEFQQGTTEATPNAVQLLLNGADLLRLLVARKGEIDSLENKSWYSSLTASLAKGLEEAATQLQPEKPSHSPARSMPEEIDQVRVAYSLIEELLGLSQEILLSEKTLPTLSQEHKTSGLKTWIDHYTSLLKDLYFRLAQLRLMSVADFSDLFLKTIRGLAREHNKEVRLEVIGGEVQADIALLERLREPFIHLFRNCITHGIEPPDERVRAGKNAEGRIILEAWRERDNLFIKVSDDGQGINRSAIGKYLKDKRTMEDEQIARMSEEDFFNTILSTDFSSARKTTDMAGRGIGMNVVAQAIEYLGGSMTIHSAPSKGTELLLKLPVSLSIMHSVTFKVGKYTLSIPTSDVESIDRGGPISPYESEPLYDLRGLLGVSENGGEFSYILKLKHPREKSRYNSKDGNIELGVDQIIGNRPLMVMPVGELLAKARLFAGVGIMENGDVSILLDIENLLGVETSSNR